MFEIPAAPQLEQLMQKPSPDGVPVSVAPGLMLIRLPLPFRLNHVNIYLIDDGDGWAVFDSGIGNRTTKDLWLSLLSEHVRRPLTRLIVSHSHPDHVGMAGWLTDRFAIPLHMTSTEYLFARTLHLDPGSLGSEEFRRFHLSHGLAPDVTEQVLTRGHEYLRSITGLPGAHRRMMAGDRLTIGHRVFDVLTGGGHSPEQAMLYCAEDKIFLAADQVLNRITPNVSVYANEPDGNPLGLYLRSLTEIANVVAGDALVLPGHEQPFDTPHARIAELKAHHEARCAEIIAACRQGPQSAADLVPVIFRRKLDAHQMGFAFNEVLAHVNYLIAGGSLTTAPSDEGIVRYVV